jgi:cytochrome c-type biogenesis protein CcmH
VIPSFRRVGTTLRQVIVTALIALAATAAFAIDVERAFEDPVLQARYESINRELRCLVCRSETIADSNADLAADLRRQVRELIAAGKTDDEIRDYMTQRYGDFVLYRPRFNAANFLLWTAPALLLLIGSFVAVRVIRRRAAESEVDPWDTGAGPT